MRISYFFSLLLLGCVLSVPMSAQKKYAKATFFAREYRSQGDTLRYRILYPENYDKEEKTKYPLVIFLHGEGENGNDNQSQLKYGSSLFMNAEMRHWFPAIVIFPQCPENDQWATYEMDSTGVVTVPAKSDETATSYILNRMIEHYKKNKTVDKDRIYLIGISAGATGALDLAVREPKTFAAVVSIGGAIDAPRMKALKKMPLRMYHGTLDSIVPVSYARDAYYELKADGAEEAEIIEYSETGHECWREAMSSSDFLKWLFSKER
ncbi:MAG: alpha/beta hydrolase-fold protein [Paludibacteraceae bacterium]